MSCIAQILIVIVSLGALILSFFHHNSSRAFQNWDNAKIGHRPLFGLVKLCTMALKSIDEINYCGTKRTISDYGTRLLHCQDALSISTTNPRIVVCLSQSERLYIPTPNASVAISLCLRLNR